MSEDLPHHQHISGVSTQNHSQAFVGSARDVYFAVSHNAQEASKQAAVACRNALFLTDPHVDRESVISAKGTRVAGTCEWITHNASYRAWLNSDGEGDDSTRLLWISGGPGKGKTMMSVFLTEELERHTARMDNTELAFFFCSAEDEKRSTAVAVLRGLVHQIIAKRPQLVKHALPYFETPERAQQTLASLETLWIIFAKLTSDTELGTIFCVLDGLDECEESTLRVLLPRIVSLLSIDASPSTTRTYKLAIISRDIPGMQGCTRIKLDPDNDEKVVGDIELFVSARVAELSRIEGFNDDFRAAVQSALLQRAGGTFLWVGFAMYELSQKQTCSEIWAALEELPSGLPAIYSRMLLRIPARQREVSRAILQWVTMAVRPLQLRELAAAIGVQATSPWMTVEQVARDAVTLCGPLLKVQKQEQEVSLVHQSARDYLLRKERDNDVVLEGFRLDPRDAHLKLAQTCIECIATSPLQYKAMDLDNKPDPRRSPLLRYATLHWPEHARSCSTLAAKLFDPSGLFLQAESSLRGHWLDIYNKMTGRDVSPLLLHMACTLEIIPWIEAVLPEAVLPEAGRSRRTRYDKPVDIRDDFGKTALHLAALRGNEAVVRLLVEKGADVKAKDKNGMTALHGAASEGNEAMVRLLVDRGADVNAKSNDGETVLHVAASFWRGNEAVVRLLVNSGADVKAKDNDGITAL
ncbi:hypothetical protein GMOD_00004939 [Pyrenophora seminiperda CCB06]|uniref:Uncharacterized protein n=1 Tax=Pyrenophora seminiperda CCB06 TaxID=1302712 RepID=A0A3M7MI40_9PLEO|nr:hypothetical protein GMOD_00004939 [Pyrenophora seminiperda CCB06]